MSSKISTDIEKILGGIQKAKKIDLTPNEQIALKTTESILIRKADDELSIDDIEQLTMNLNFLKEEVLVQNKELIESFLSNLDGKESTYFN
jgi:hypothetical protein